MLVMIKINMLCFECDNKILLKCVESRKNCRHHTNMKNGFRAKIKKYSKYYSLFLILLICLHSLNI